MYYMLSRSGSPMSRVGTWETNSVVIGAIRLPLAVHPLKLRAIWLSDFRAAATSFFLEFSPAQPIEFSQQACGQPFSERSFRCFRVSHP